MKRSVKISKEARSLRRLTAQRKQMLRADLPRLLKANLSTALIATLYDVSQRTITRWIKSLGLIGERLGGKKPRPKKRLHVER
jgi:transposase